MKGCAGGGVDGSDADAYASRTWREPSGARVRPPPAAAVHSLTVRPVGVPERRGVHRPPIAGPFAAMLDRARDAFSSDR
jgi:hypothetical protein